MLLWLIETDVFQMPQLHKHLNVACNAMTPQQLKELVENLKTKGVGFDEGLTEQEILQVEQKIQL